MAWVLTNADIVQAMPLLADFYDKADSGTTSTLVCKRLTGLDSDEVIGSVLSVVTGDNEGADVTISAFDSSTGSMTFSALTNAIVSGVVFGVVSMNYQAYIDRSYNIIQNEMRNLGKDVDNFLTTAQVKELHLMKSLQIICMAKRQNADTDDVYHQSYLDFKQLYETELNNLKADYDSNEDGTIDTGEELQQTQVILG